MPAHLAGKLEPPPEVERIARTLEKAGFETWCVGGAVRDALLGHPHLDWDLATAARPDEVRKLFRRTVPVGIEFGTVGVLDNENVMHEVTTFRRDVNTDGRHAVVEFGVSLEEDLARRDYTINAIAFSPLTREERDPFDGKKDLEKGIVRAVGEPAERMREDRLRALRGIRFASRFDFQIEKETWTAITASAPHLTRLSAERVKQEIEKTMEQVQKPSVAFKMWRDSGALEVLVPVLSSVTDLDLSAIDHVCLPGDSRHAARQSSRRLARITALFSPASTEQLADALKQLRFSNAEAKWITSVITSWRQIAGEMSEALTERSEAPDVVLRRWAQIAGRTRLASVIRLAAARWAAERNSGMSAPTRRRVMSVYRKALRIAYRDPIEVADLAVGGVDLEEIGLRGPAVGRVLRKLLENVINDPAVNTRERLLALAANEK
ncbi:MAG TPA: CCA tRNA nucleotidyltransferase [Gemmatimonadaceae bacterium]|nr:CCA tRNA nucleotidyltransferase [Gemmatimonadaceae bacterium]